MVFNASMTVCLLFAIHQATNHSEYYITSPINRRILTNYKARSLSVVLSQHWASLLRTEINDSEFGTSIFHLNLRPIPTHSNDVLSLKNTTHSELQRDSKWYYYAVERNQRFFKQVVKTHQQCQQVNILLLYKAIIQ